MARRTGADGKVPVFGGPADGARVRDHGVFAWIATVRAKVIARPVPFDDAHLYRWGRGTYHHVHGRTMLCGGCGAYRPRERNPCPLCGHTPG